MEIKFTGEQDLQQFTSLDEVIDQPVVLAILGGPNKPIHKSTLFRGIRSGRYPRPLKIGPKLNRWLLSEVKAVISARAAERKV